MSRFRLRYQATDFELPGGEFFVGRSSSCDLALDDALVSRRHAVFRLTNAGLEVEDLGSRNGVLVNEERIEAPCRLNDRDRVTIGAQVLVVQKGTGADGKRPRNTMSKATLEIMVPSDGRESSTPDDTTGQITGFELLLNVAEKAMGLGRFPEAERILSKQLNHIRAQADREPERLKRETIVSAMDMAARLAAGLRNAEWLDWAFDVSRLVKVPPTAATVDRLHEVVRTVNYANPAALRDCIGALQQVPDLSAADRFALKRLVGLERVVSAL